MTPTYVYTRDGEPLTISPAGITLIGTDGEIAADVRHTMPDDVMVGAILDAILAGWVAA